MPSLLPEIIGQAVECARRHNDHGPLCRERPHLANRQTQSDWMLALKQLEASFLERRDHLCICQQFIGVTDEREWVYVRWEQLQDCLECGFAHGLLSLTCQVAHAGWRCHST